ncbi:DUF4234 domain-containing protein [Sandaracinus amylolyticus]|uniref:DUF4234 domain-containing protein n=1 Tax=Sandaracinus amylolyticus TaxID=927083 RepID=UPI001F2872C1|nr:DUF4234 domain-containing protein [Sandaracinus amylolyticus]UJR83941.1 Hypothetical protein I5071_60120 [Sandaracinus amylolyticus]
MTKREPWIVLVLTFVTCGLYHLWWQYSTTEELKRVSGRDDLNPTMDLILTLLTCGLWVVYVAYRNAQVVHEMYGSRGMQHDDKSTLLVILYAVAVFNGVTAFIAPMILQDEINKLADRVLGSAGPAPSTF